MIKAAAATTIGRSHIASGSRCQDAVAIVSRRYSACVALADGAGSKARSDIGAQIASLEAARTVLDNFDRLFALVDSDPQQARELVLNRVLTALKRKNKRKKLPLDTMASTLLFAAYKGGKYVAGHIGDGVIGFLCAPDTKVLSAPENGEYSNSTYFVTDRDALSHLRLYTGSAEAGFGVVLMSDGTAESLYHRATGQLGAAVVKLFDWSRQLSEKKLKTVLQANLEQVFSKKTADDCSLALLAVA